MARIVVTGGSGKLGRACVKDLLEHGHQDETVFKINTVTTYNVFEAARRLGIKNVVWASSETLLGLPFDEPPPYFPLDEEYAARPVTGYSLSKLVGEEMAKQFCRWDPDLKIVCLRFSNACKAPCEDAPFFLRDFFAF